MEPFVVDPRQTTPEELAEGMRQAQTLFIPSAFLF